MSCSALWRVYRTTRTSHAEYRNGHGTGPAIWDLMAREHLGLERVPMFGDMKPLWALGDKPTVPLHRRIVHCMTFDLALTPAHKLAETADACDRVHEEILSLTDWTWSHFKAIAADLRALSEKKIPRLLGVGLGCTSVSDPWEDWPPRDGKKPFDAYAYARRGEALPHETSGSEAGGAG